MRANRKRIAEAIKYLRSALGNARGRVTIYQKRLEKAGTPQDRSALIYHQTRVQYFSYCLSVLLGEYQPTAGSA